MLSIKNVRFGPADAVSIYVRPLRMVYEQDHVEKSWDLVECHHSVAVVIFNTTRNVLICVKQFRPGVYMNSIPKEDRQGVVDVEKYPPTLGVTLEFCAGIVDKAKSLETIAAEEVLEECGYKVEEASLRFAHEYRSSVGISGDAMTLYYVEVTDDMRITSGGGVDKEFIEIVELTIPEAEKLLKGPTGIPVSGEFLFALAWFLKVK